MATQLTVVNTIVDYVSEGRYKEQQDIRRMDLLIGSLQRGTYIANFWKFEF